MLRMPFYQRGAGRGGGVTEKDWIQVTGSYITVGLSLLYLVGLCPGIVFIKIPQGFVC